MRIVQIVAGILLFVAVAVFAVQQQIRVVQLGYDLHSLEAEREQLAETSRKLQAAIAAKRHPRRLAQAARAHELPIEPPHATPSPPPVSSSRR